MKTRKKEKKKRKKEKTECYEIMSKKHEMYTKKNSKPKYYYFISVISIKFPNLDISAGDPNETRKLSRSRVRTIDKVVKKSIKYTLFRLRSLNKNC